MTVVALPVQTQKAIITEAADRYGVKPSTLWGVYGTETDFGKNVAVSSAGAEGPLQLEPTTAKSLGVKDPQNLKESALGAAHYLSEFKGRGLPGMLSAYNAGPAGGLQPEYVKTTEQNAKTFGGEPPSSLGKAQSLSPITGFNKEAFQKAQGLAALGKLVFKEGGSSNPLFATGVLSTTEPTRSEYTKASLPKVANQARPPASAQNGTYRNPFSGDSTVTPERIDQGVDYALRPGEAIKAIGNGVVKGVIPNWFQGQPFVWYELTSGPDAGKSIYVAEQISPTVKAGDRLTAGQTIGTYARSGTGIETGFATKGGGTLASVTGGYSEGQRTSAGDAASKLFASTGAPAGLPENRPTTGDVIAEHNGGKIVKQPKGPTVYYPKR